MMLLLAILFLNPVTSFESYAIDAPFKYSLIKINGYSYKNSITVHTIKDELTGKVRVDQQFCKFSLPDDHPLGTDMLIVYPEKNTTLDYFIWRCVTTWENGKLSAEPFRCVYRTENGTNVEMIPGESSQTNNGSIKHHCDFANGGLRRVTEYVPGCYHNGTVYAIGQEWSEQYPGVTNNPYKTWMTCQRGESGYFEKRIRGCFITKSAPKWKLSENGSFIVTNETFEYDDYMTLNEVRILSDSQTENREMERCVETEPGHVAVMKATEEEVGCNYKNQFHKYNSYWKDHEMGAVLKCEHDNKIEKKECLVNGTEYYVSHFREHKLSNGCIFICHHRKNIYKCPDQLKYMEVVMETATTRIPTNLRAELGF